MRNLRPLSAVLLVLASGCTGVLGDDFSFPGSAGATGAGGGSSGAGGTGGSGTGGATGGTSAGKGGTTSGNGGSTAGTGGAGKGGTGTGGTGGTSGTGGTGGTGGTAGAGTGGAGKGGGTGGGTGGGGASGAGGTAGTCGNNTKDGSEDCDGTDLGGATCTSVAGKPATGNLACGADCHFVSSSCQYCGNAKRDGAELCDGADLGGTTCMSAVSPDSTGTLACKADCTLDVSACSKPATCGNGMLDANEKCDGGKFGTATCTTVIGKSANGSLSCTPQCTIDSSACQYCGDGSIQGAEQCDGVTFGAATCATVTVHPGATGQLACTASCTVDASGCAFCGDNKTEPGEQCDGTDLNGATCSSVVMAVATGSLGCSTCKFDTSNCQFCGDGKIGGTEKCDGANLGQPAATCSTAVGAGSVGSVSCSASCKFDVSGCTAPTGCGDGTKSASEQCDGQMFGGATCATVTKAGATGTLTCTPACTIDASACVYCGDGVVNNGEACDPPSLGGATCVTVSGVPTATGTLGCAADCSKLDASGCAWCGNGKKDTGESCDQGDLGGATCVTLNGPTATGLLGCTGSCAFNQSACKWCGDGVKNNNELCDGNDLGGRTCASAVGPGSTGVLHCQTASGCTQFDTSQCTAATLCGNGTVDAGEQCDPPNTTLSNYCGIATGVATATGVVICSSNCQYDTSQCQWCGNGKIDPAPSGEQCDGADLGQPPATCPATFSGSPSCNSTCKLDNASCVCAAPSGVCVNATGVATCVNFSTDNANCGFCSHNCGPGVACSGGLCAPQAVLPGALSANITDFASDGSSILFFVTATSTTGAIGYWLANGSGQTVLPSTALLANASYLAMDNNNVYVAAQAGGYRVTATSRSTQTTSTLSFVAGETANPTGLGVASGSLYFSGTASGATPHTFISYVNYDGSGYMQAFSEGLYRITYPGLAVWFNPGFAPYVFFGRQEGSYDIEDIYITSMVKGPTSLAGAGGVGNAKAMQGITVTGNTLFWTAGDNFNAGGIRTINTDGTGYAEIVSYPTAGQAFPSSIAADSNGVYWADVGFNTINVVQPNGFGQYVLANTSSTPGRVVIDNAYVYWLQDAGTSTSKIVRVHR